MIELMQVTPSLRLASCRVIASCRWKTTGG